MLVMRMPRGQARGVYTEAEKKNLPAHWRRKDSRIGPGYRLIGERHSLGLDMAGIPYLEDLSVGYTAYPSESYQIEPSAHGGDFFQWAIWACSE
jgi:hypothetical protein